MNDLVNESGDLVKDLVNDCISRRAAIEALKMAEALVRAFGYHAAIDAVEALPLAQPGWIPVTERLPEYFVPVLTWDGQNQCVEMRIPYVITTEGEIIKSDWWCEDYWEDKEESLYHPYDLRDGAALAWMPLPKPWEGGTG